MKKQLFAVILAFVLMFTFQQVFAEGTCGEFVNYTVRGDTITFSKSISNTDAIWHSDCRDVFRNDPNIKIVKVAEPIKVVNAAQMFADCPYVEEMYLSKLDVSNVDALYDLFDVTWSLEEQGLESSLKILDLSGWDTSKVEDMSWTFNNCRNLESLDISGWDTSKVESMYHMFSDCRSLKSLDLSRWNTSKVTNMYYMFYQCYALESLNVGSWNTSRVTNMGDMFSSCRSLKSLNLYNWNTAKVTNMESMFFDCGSLTGLDLSGWDTSKVTNMKDMFMDCTGMTDLNLSGWNTSNVTEFGFMFYGCDALKTLTLGKNTLKTNIFESLPAYKNPWSYAAAGADAGAPLNIGTNKMKGTLFTGYDFNKMAGTWKALPLARSVRIQNPRGTNISGKTIKVTRTTYQLKAAAAPKTAVQQFSWKSSNTNIAVVRNGRVTFKKAGTVTITATAKDGSYESNWVKLTTNIKATRVNIRNSSGKLINHKTITVKNKTVRLKAVAVPVKFAAQNFRWQSSNSSIATVNAGVVTFKKAGTVKITATAKDRSGKSNWVKLVYKSR